MTRAALLQLNASDDPVANLVTTRDFLRQAALGGAKFVLTPEVTNCISSSRSHQNRVLQPQSQDQTLAALRQDAQTYGIWLLIGSLALKTEDAEGRFANRSFLITPVGEIAAWYDKIHMFDVTVSDTETYRESAGYRPGTRAVCADTPFGGLGMTICYDLRFPYLHRKLAQAGATILTVPSAFSPVTGAAHWAPLLQARAIETGCYVLAPAQTGTHNANLNRPRKTYGHSLAVSPWGEIIADAGTDACVTFITLDSNAPEAARRKIPALRHDQLFDGP